jgi:hypothetical protein
MRFTVIDSPDRPQEDVWIRLPLPRGRCPHTGLARTTLDQLVERSKGEVKTVLLKKPGSLRGIRLIHLGSLQSYLTVLAKTQLRTPSAAKEQEAVPCKK